MIKDLTELALLLKLCRAEGVTEIDIGSHRIKFGELPPKRSRTKASKEEIQSHELTEEQLMYYSANPGSTGP